METILVCLNDIDNNYFLLPEYVTQLEDGGLRFTGVMIKDNEWNRLLNCLKVLHHKQSSLHISIQQKKQEYNSLSTIFLFIQVLRKYGPFFRKLGFKKNSTCKK